MALPLMDSAVSPLHAAPLSRDTVPSCWLTLCHSARLPASKSSQNVGVGDCSVQPRGGPRELEVPMLLLLNALVLANALLLLMALLLLVRPLLLPKALLAAALEETTIWLLLVTAAVDVEVRPATLEDVPAALEDAPPLPAADELVPDPPRLVLADVAPLTDVAWELAETLELPSWRDVTAGWLVLPVAAPLEPPPVETLHTPPTHACWEGQSALLLHRRWQAPSTLAWSAGHSCWEVHPSPAAHSAPSSRAAGTSNSGIRPGRGGMEAGSYHALFSPGAGSSQGQTGPS